MRQKNISIFHIAPEHCYYPKYKEIASKNSGTYRCCDISMDRSSFFSELEQIDITSIPYPDDTFDLVHCSEVFEHVPNDIQAMREIYRCLKPNGVAFLTVPRKDSLDSIYEDFSIVDPKERKDAFGQEDHVRWYTTDGFISRLTSVGFSVSVKSEPDLPKELKEKEMHLFSSDLLFIAIK